MSAPTPPAASVTALGLTIEHGGTALDVVVELPHGASVGSLAQALAATIPELPPLLDLAVRRTGERLPTDAIVMDRDVRAGDALVVLPRAGRHEPGPPRSPGRAQPLRGGAPSGRAASAAAADDDLVALRRGPGILLRSLAGDPAPGGRAGAAPSGAAVARLGLAGEHLDLPAGEHRVCVDRSGRLVSDPGGAAVVLIAQARPGALEVLSDPDGPEVGVDGTVAGHEWLAVPDGGRIRAGRLTVRASVPEPEHPRAAGGRMVIGDELGGRPRIDLEVGGEVPIHRPPRRLASWRPTTVALPDTPRPQQRLRLPLVAAVIPIIGGLLMFAIFGRASMLAFMALSPMMVAGTYFTDRRHRKEDADGVAARFETRLAAAYAQLVEVMRTEAHERREAAPPVTQLLEWVAALHPRLWERRPWDPDFLTLRLGLGHLPAASGAELRPQNDVEPDPRLQPLVDASRVLPDVPSVVELGHHPVVGLAGHRTVSSDIARSLVLQAAALHSPLELGLIAALPPGADQGWDWLKWLPHTRTAAGVIGGPPLGTGRQAVDLLRQLRDSGERRLVHGRQHGAQPAGQDAPALLIVIDEQLQLDRALVSEILGNAAALRYAVIWIGRDPRSLPGECSTTVDCGASGLASVVSIPHEQEHRIALEGATIAQAALAARALAPTRDATLAAGSAVVPDRVKLLDQLALPEPSAEGLAERWQRRRPGLGAAIGMGAGQPMRIDLRSDGPHALIAGTTGAGKSELLRTIVASLAIAHPPSRLTFLLIDYKGGAAFAPCAALPHVLDVVSDLDAELGERALVSLRAEMTHREHLLAKARADNIVDLERRAPELAPPNLVIMVDEFAKLREEIPDFVDGVVDVAQRGRTLGIHMVLAAQSLRTAFTPAVRANTNLRIALRVTNDTESQDVIEAYDAARIPSGDARRGRAYARIGHERLVEFQSAHVSGRHRPPGEAEVVVRHFGFDTLAVPSVRRDRREDGPPGPDETDLAAIGRAAAAAGELLGLRAPRPAWTAPLPHRLPRSAVQPHTDVRRGHCAIGLLDEPARQRQTPFVLALDRGNVAIYGASGTGKTVALQTIAASLAWDASPAELQLYAIDADGGPLSLIEPLPHVASVVPAADAERVERLLDRLETEIRRRTTLHASVGAGTLTEYLDASGVEPLARIVLLVDGMAEFSGLYESSRPGSLLERLAGVVGSGRGVGVHVVATADRRAGIRSQLSPAFTQRLALRQTTPEDLIAFGVAPRLADRIELGPGRAFTQDELIVQLALPAAAHDATDAADAFRRLGRHLGQVWPGGAAPSIDTLPEAVLRAELSRSSPAIDAIPIGIGGGRLELAHVDLTERHFLVSGSYRSGRSTALRALAEGAAACAELAFVELLAPRRSALTSLDCWTAAARGVEASVEAAKALAARIVELPESHVPVGVVVIDDGGELGDPAVIMALERVVRLGRDRGVRVVAGLETSTARMLSNLWVRELRRDAHGLLLTPDLLTDGDILGVTLPRHSTVAMGPGRGFLVQRGKASLVQVAGLD